MRSKLGMHEPLASRRCSRCTASASSGAVQVISLLCSHRSGRRRLPSTKRDVGADDRLTSRLGSRTPDGRRPARVSRHGRWTSTLASSVLSTPDAARCGGSFADTDPTNAAAIRASSVIPRAQVRLYTAASARTLSTNARRPARAQPSPAEPDMVVQPLERVWCPHGTQRRSAEVPTCRPPGGGQPIRSRGRPTGSQVISNDRAAPGALPERMTPRRPSSPV